MRFATKTISLVLGCIGGSDTSRCKDLLDWSYRFVPFQEQVKEKPSKTKASAVIELFLQARSGDLESRFVRNATKSLLRIVFVGLESS
jgi:hypothetical protein